MPRASEIQRNDMTTIAGSATTNRWCKNSTSIGVTSSGTVAWLGQHGLSGYAWQDLCLQHKRNAKECTSDDPSLIALRDRRALCGPVRARTTARTGWHGAWARARAPRSARAEDRRALLGKWHGYSSCSGGSVSILELAGRGIGRLPGRQCSLIIRPPRL